MFRIVACLTAAVCLVSIMGCGGGSGTGGDPTLVQDQIQQTRFSPKYVTIKVGGQIRWVNVDAIQHQIVSGTLDPQGSPLVIYTIDITITGFNPMALTADLGNTIRFNNISGVAFVMDVVDDNGNLVSTVSFAIGELKTFTFPGAGKFTFRQHGSQIFQGTIILFGQPNPYGVFESPVLGHGQSFTVQFGNAGSLPYYDLDLNNPNQSFKTGVITVQ
jgi:plastocyanin